MNRSDLLRACLPVLKGRLTICNIGLPSQELHMMQDEASNFYMLGTMGLASSIGLGLALTQRAPVVAIDGDGSVLTNLGTLVTMANNPAPNFTLLIVDNGSYGSTGDQPTYTSGKTDLAKVARACGCETVIACSAEDTPGALAEALERDGMTVIVARCAPGNIPVPVIGLDAPVIRHRFMEEVARQNL